MSKYLELVEVSEGVVVLRRSDQKDAPLVKIEFSSEVKTLLNGMEFDVAKEMIKSGIETLNSDIDMDALDDDVFDSFLKKDLEDRFIHFSDKVQIFGTLKKYFFKQKDLVLLKVEALELDNLVYEQSSDGNMFPHLYSVLDTKYVKNVYDIKF